MAKRNRTRLYIDGNVQGTIIKRVILYWAACVAFMTLPLILGKVYEEPQVFILSQIGAVASRYWPVYLVMTCMLPFAITDSLRLSNKLVGPIIRIKSELQKVNQGMPFRSISLREDDFCHDLASEINQAYESMDDSRARKESSETVVSS